MFEQVEPVWRQLIVGYGIQLRIEELLAEGDMVAARYTETGTFPAEAFGHQPTGKSYQLVAMEFFEIQNGKIRRRWGAKGFRFAGASARDPARVNAWRIRADA